MALPVGLAETVRVIRTDRPSPDQPRLPRTGTTSPRLPDAAAVERFFATSAGEVLRRPGRGSWGALDGVEALLGPRRRGHRGLGHWDWAALSEESAPARPGDSPTMPLAPNCKCARQRPLV